MAIITPQGFDAQVQKPLELKRTRDTIADRDAITTATRYEGLTVYVLEDQTDYQLRGGITNDDWYTYSDWSHDGSNIYYTAGFVGIGTSAPEYRFDVSGDSRITGDLSVTGDFTVTGTINNDSIFLKTDFIQTSTGSDDASKPIILGDDGKIDASMINNIPLYYVITFTPTSSDEYPSTLGHVGGAYWIISGVVEYIYQDGDLTNKVARDGDYLVWDSSSWLLLTSSVYLNDYYKLDGSNQLTANFDAGDFRLTNIAAATDGSDAVTLDQLIEYTVLPIASQEQLGIVQVGENLTITADGILAAVSSAEEAEWGYIIGDITNQADLNDVLSLKANSADIFTKLDHVVVGGTTSEAGKPIILDSVGKIDSSLYNSDALGSWLDNYFEWDEATETIKCLYNLAAAKEITAWQSTADSPSFWDSMPLATSSSIGGIYANNSTEGYRNGIIIDTDGFLAVDPSYSSGAEWGSITGALSSQTDLQDALNGKLSTTGKAADSDLLDGMDSSEFFTAAKFDSLFEVTYDTDGTTVIDIKAKSNLSAYYEITAWQSGTDTPSLWDSMPLATSTTIGGIYSNSLIEDPNAVFRNGIRLDADGFLEVDPSYSDGTTEFINLTDTPASYTGNAGGTYSQCSRGWS